MPGSSESRAFRAALLGGPDSKLQLSARGWELHHQHLPLSRSELEEVAGVGSGGGWGGAGGVVEGGWLFTLVKHSDFGKCFLSSLFWKNN